jgi:hypothetical protein
MKGSGTTPGSGSLVLRRKWATCERLNIRKQTTNAGDNVWEGILTYCCGNIN